MAQTLQHQQSHQTGAPDLTGEIVEDIRDFVNTQSDLVQQTIQKLTNERSITRYINLLIYNIVEYCLLQLSEESAEQMINQITETLLQSLSVKQTSNLQLSSIFELAPVQSLQPPIYNFPMHNHQKSHQQHTRQPVINEAGSASPPNNSIFIQSGAAPESSNQTSGSSPLLQSSLLSEVHNQVDKQSICLNQIQQQLNKLQQDVGQVSSGVSLAVEDSRDQLYIKETHQMLKDAFKVFNQIDANAKIAADNALLIHQFEHHQDQDQRSADAGSNSTSPAKLTLGKSKSINQRQQQQSSSILAKQETSVSSKSNSNTNHSKLNNSGHQQETTNNSEHSSAIGGQTNSQQQDEDENENGDDSSDDNDINSVNLEESKSPLTDEQRQKLGSSSLPDMWNKTEAKRGDGYFIFGAHPKSSANPQQQLPVSKLSNQELSQRLRRQTQIQCSESISNWTCPFISSGTAYDSGLIFSRGKGNKLHVYNQDLSTIIVKETSGHGLFSCRVHNNLAWIGCYDGHLFVFDVNTFEKKDYKKLQQGIYDIQVFEDDQNGVKEEFIIFGQHFGHVDIIKVDTMRKVLQTKPLKVNTIFNIIMTTRKAEICFCGYNGMFFGKLKRDQAKGTFELVMSLTETYFADRYVSRGIEYQPDKFVVCIQDDEQFYMIDRSKKLITAKIAWGIPQHCSNSFNFELYKVPGYHAKKFPFLLVRDDYGIKIFNVLNPKRGVIRVKDAFYGSQAGYKTLDIISSPTNQNEFEIVYLETGETDAPNNATTTINRLLFTQGFMTSLKQLLQ